MAFDKDYLQYSYNLLAYVSINCLFTQIIVLTASETSHLECCYRLICVWFSWCASAVCRSASILILVFA